MVQNEDFVRIEDLIPSQHQEQFVNLFSHFSRGIELCVVAKQLLIALL